MSDNINVEVKKKNPSIPPKNLKELTKQVSEIEGTIDDINESVEEAEQDVHEIKRAINNSDDFVIRDNKFKRKNKVYNPAQYSGLGEIYLEKNETFLGREFDEFVVNVNVPDPTAIAETFDGLVYDRHRKEFLAYELVDGERIYYAEWIKFDKWESTDDYVPEAGYDFICEADNKAYRWTEETTPDLIETEAHYGNVLKQEMVNLSNTIYHIQYDYDLIGKEITIPEGCLFHFEGGSLNNGTIVGQNTKIEATPLKIFNDVVIDGIWSVSDIYSQWFPFSEDSSIDNLLNFRNLFKLTNSNTKSNIYINKGTYYTSAWTINEQGIQVDTYGIAPSSHTYIHNSAVIKVFDNNFERTSLFVFDGVEDCLFEGGRLVGNIRNHNENINGDHTYGIYLVDARNIIIQDVTIEEFWSDGIDIQSAYYDYEHGTCEHYSRNIYLNHVKCLNNGRQALSVEGCVGLWCTNCEFSGTGSIKAVPNGPWCGIDIEPWYEGQPVSDLHFSDCVIINNKSGINIYQSLAEDFPSNITIDNVITGGVSIRSSNVNISNSVFSYKNILNSPRNAGHLSFIGGNLENILVKNCTFSGEIYGNADISNLTIENCSFDIDNGVNYGGGFAYFKSLQNSIIRNNTINDSRDTTLNFIVIATLLNDNVNVENNNFTFKYLKYIGVQTNFLNNSIKSYQNDSGITLSHISGNKLRFENNYIDIGNYVSELIVFDDENLSSDANYDYIISNNKIINKGAIDSFISRNINSRVLLNNNYFSNGKVNNIFRDTDSLPCKIDLNNDRGIDTNSYSFTFTKSGNTLATTCACIKIKNCRFLGKLSIFRNATQAYNLNSITRFIECDGNTDIYLSPAHINTRLNDGGSWLTALYPVIATEIKPDGYLYIYIKSADSAPVNFTLQFDIITQVPDLNLSPEYFYTEIPNGAQWDFKTDTIYTDTDTLSGVYELYPGLIKVNVSTGKINVHNGTSFIDYDGVPSTVLRSGTFANKPISANIYVGFRYFCTDRQTTEGATNGIEIIYKGQDTTDPDNPVDVWVDALGRIVS